MPAGCHFQAHAASGMCACPGQNGRTALPMSTALCVGSLHACTCIPKARPQSRNSCLGPAENLQTQIGSPKLGLPYTPDLVQHCALQAANEHMSICPYGPSTLPKHAYGAAAVLASTPFEPLQLL